MKKIKKKRKRKLLKVINILLLIFSLCMVSFIIGILIGQKKNPEKSDFKNLWSSQKDSLFLDKNDKFSFYNTLSSEKERIKNTTENSKNFLDQEKTKNISENNTKEIAEENIFTVQVGAFTQYNEAEKLVEKLKSKGYKAYFLKQELKNDKIWYRVRVGKFKNITEAKEMACQITRQENLPAFVTN